MQIHTLLLEHVRQFNGPKCSNVAGIVPCREDVDCSTRYVVLHKCENFNCNDNLFTDATSLSHRLYVQVFYFLLFQDRRDDDGMQRGELVKIQLQEGAKLILPCCTCDTGSWA